METLQQQTLHGTQGELTFSQGDSHANHLASQENARALMMTDFYGAKCLEQLQRLGHVSSWQKTFMDCLILTVDVQSKQSAPIWKISGMRGRSFLILHLIASDYQRWNGTSGLLPRPLTSDSKGACRIRTRTSKVQKGNFREVIREQETDGIYPKPDFAEWVKGFPIGWTKVTNKD